jgi:uncharacterized protein (TIGR03000 family)
MRTPLTVVVCGFAAATWLLTANPQTQGAQPTETKKARVRVLVPAGAKLTVNGKTIPGKSRTRRLVSFPLEQGKKGRFTFKAEFTSGAKTISIARSVRLHTGKNKRISLTLPRNYGAPSASARVGGRRFRTEIRRFTPEGPELLDFRRMTAPEDSVRD